MDEYTPVYGYNGMEIIGYWDEINNVYIGNEIRTFETILQHIRRYSTLPVTIQITRSKFNGTYHTFRSFGSANEKTIINITE